MKYLVLVVISLLLIACSYSDRLDEVNGHLTDHQIQLDDLKGRTTALETRISSNEAQLNILQSDFLAQGNSLSSQITAINVALVALTSSGSATQTQLDALALQVDQAILDASVLEGRVSAVEGDNVMLNMSVGSLQTDLAATDVLIQSLIAQGTAAYYDLITQGTAAYNQIQAQISALSSANAGVTANVTILQSQINSALVELAVIQGYNNIVSIKDPCGAQGAYNEVLLKLSNGQYLASFSENGSALTTRFALLTDGTFKTTDGSNCYFTVSDSGTVISNEHN